MGQWIVSGLAFAIDSPAYALNQYRAVPCAGPSHGLLSYPVKGDRVAGIDGNAGDSNGLRDITDLGELGSFLLPPRGGQHREDHGKVQLSRKLQDSAP